MLDSADNRLAYVVGALILGPASEVFGRRPVLSLSNWTLAIFQICCAVAPDTGSLVAFRFLGGIGGAGCLTLIGGLCADLFVVHERGTAGAVSGLGIIFGPSIGPLLGAFIAQRVGWRWVFWVLAIATIVMAGIMEICGHESYAPVIIHRKTLRMRRELGRPDLRSCYDLNSGSPVSKSRRLIRGILQLFTMCSSPIVLSLCIYVALTYGLLYFLIATISEVYTEIYHWSIEIAGLAYLGLGAGFFLGLFVIGSTSDKVILELKKRNKGVYEPEMRLPYMTLFGICLPASFFLYGWSADHAVQWIVSQIQSKSPSHKEQCVKTVLLPP